MTRDNSRVRFRTSTWPLAVRLLILQGLLLAVLAAGLWALLARQERLIVAHVRDYSDDLTKAVEISVGQFNKEAPDDASLASAAQGKIHKRRVKEISLLEPDKSVLATTDPQRRGGPFVIEERIGRSTTGTEPVLIPIEEDGKPVGYIHLVLALEDFAALERKLAVERTAWIGAVLLLAALLGYLAVRRVLSPVGSLANAAQRVAGGDLSVELPPPAHQDETGRLVNAFNGMVAALRQGREAERRLREAERQALVGAMGAEVAHELRNPLNYLSLSIDHLVSRCRPAESAAAAEMDAQHAQLKTEIARLSRLAGDFMTLARSGPPLVAPVPLAPLVAESVAVLAGPLAERGVRVETEIPEGFTVRADPDRLRAALGNLLHNAVLFSPAGGTVSVSAALEPGGGAAVAVSDRGPGVPAGAEAKIFEPFFTTREGGTGLGLAIVRRVAEEHGGAALVRPAAGGGAEFVLTLPGAPPEGMGGAP